MGGDDDHDEKQVSQIFFNEQRLREKKNLERMSE